MPGSKMFRESPEFYRPVDFVDIRKAKDVTPENGVRLYSTQRAVSWRLQVRGLLTLATGRESKDFVIAGASLDREALVALRDAIDEALKAPGRITIPGNAFAAAEMYAECMDVRKVATRFKVEVATARRWIRAVQNHHAEEGKRP